MARSDDRLDILRGTLDTLVLSALDGSELHGFEIALWLEQRSGGTLHLDDSALYQCLHRLDDRGFIRGEWGVSENNRRARYYALTPSGRRHLEQERSRLVSFAQTITGVLTGPRRRGKP